MAPPGDRGEYGDNGRFHKQKSHPSMGVHKKR